MLRFASKVLAAAAVFALFPHAAPTQPQTSGVAAQPDVTFTLGDHDGIFVDRGTFKGIKGSGTKGNADAVLAKMGAKEVSAGAIIYRSGEKLYILDGTPPANATPQFMVELKDWCPTCSWYQRQSW